MCVNRRRAGCPLPFNNHVLGTGRTDMPSQKQWVFAMIGSNTRLRTKHLKELHEFLKSAEKDGFSKPRSASKLTGSSFPRLAREGHVGESAETVRRTGGKDADGETVSGRPAKDNRRLARTAQLVQDGKLKGDDTIEKTITDRTKSMKDAYEDAIVKLGKDASEWKTNSVKWSPTT